MTESPASSVQHIAWTVESDEERELRARHRNRRPLYKKKTLADAHCIAIRPCEAQHHTKAAINDYFGMKRCSRDHHCARGNWIFSLSIMELANSRSTSRNKHRVQQHTMPPSLSRGAIPTYRPPVIDGVAIPLLQSCPAIHIPKKHWSSSSSSFCGVPQIRP